MKNPAILVADDDPEVLGYLETALLCHKYPVIAAQDGNEVLALLEEHKDVISALVLDVMMPCKDGIETLSEVRRLYPDLPVVMISGAADRERIVEAMQAGAQEYLTKPVVHDRLLEVVRRTLSWQPAAEMEAGSGREGTPVSYVQVNARMRAISEALRKTAAWNVPVVLRGESGVGKEVLARELHLLSPRAGKEFVKINCVALPSELLESELFGYERGAFTGAFRSKPGKFEQADGGTMLLDEIGDMDLKLQAKLLQVLQDGEFHRLGGKEPVRVDVRVLVATHRDLERSIEEGTVREDLYYRRNVVSIEVPPLRERKDEILPLAEHFLKKHSQDDDTPLELPEELKLAFLAYDWPGNVRELENVVRRFLVFEDAPRLARHLLMGPSARLATRNAVESGFGSAAAETPLPARVVPGDPAAGPAAPAEGAWARAQAAGAGASRIHGPAGPAANTGSLPADSTRNPATTARGGEVPAGESIPGGLGNAVTNGTVRGFAVDHPPATTASGESHATAMPRPDYGQPLARTENHSIEPAQPGEPAQNPQDWPSRLTRLESLLDQLVTRIGGSGATETAQPSKNEEDDEGTPEITTLGELDRQRNEAESQAILAALEQTEWNRKKAARLLATDYKALLYRMKKLGIGERSEEA